MRLTFPFVCEEERADQDQGGEGASYDQKQHGSGRAEAATTKCQGGRGVRAEWHPSAPCCPPPPH
eukprot:SAG22_NODE_844_length_6872_cov_10.004577_10_plen_65_part_00